MIAPEKSCPLGDMDTDPEAGVDGNHEQEDM